MADLKGSLSRILNKMKVDTTSFQALSGEQYKNETIKNWSKMPCGSIYSEKEFLTKEYLDEIEDHRYSSHPWILDSINSFDLQGKKVLEIGCGMGTDHLSLARKDGIMHGLDLIPRHLEITRKRLSLYGYKSRLILGDAEFLPYPTHSLDFVYSFGVLQHSPDTEKAVSEIHRVLKPGGKCFIALYHKHSIFFWWSVFLWNFILKKGWKKRTLQEQLSLIEQPNDNPNIVTRLYRKKDLKEMFSQFSHTRRFIKHLIPADIVYFSSFFKDPFKPSPFLDWLGIRWGWYIAIEATK